MQDKERHKDTAMNLAMLVGFLAMFIVGAVAVRAIGVTVGGWIGVAAGLLAGALTYTTSGPKNEQ